jgi:hypothetical protein
MTVSHSQPSNDLVTTLRDMRTPLAVAAAARIEELEGALQEVSGCFDAAYAEGLSERLAEADQDVGTLADLILRRLVYAHHASINALQPKDGS